MKKLFEKFLILENNEYILRELISEDYLDIYEMYSDEICLKYLTIKCFKSLDDSKNLINNVEKAYENKFYIRWALENKLNNKVIGLLTLSNINYEDNKAELGYILNRKYWKKGIMYENLKFFILRLFNNTDIKILKVQIHPENECSIKLVTKLGFTQLEENKNLEHIKENGIIMELKKELKMENDVKKEFKNPVGEVNIVYFSKSNNTHEFVEKLDYKNKTRIPLDMEEKISVDKPYVLFSPTYCSGKDKLETAVPKQVKEFLSDENNAKNCYGVVASGNIQFAKTFCMAGTVLSQQLNVPLLYEYELSGKLEDVKNVRKILNEFFK